MFLEMSVGEAKVYRYKTTFQGEGKKSLEICSTTVLDVLVGAPIKISYCKSQTKSHSGSVSLSFCLNRHIKNDGPKTKKTNISQHAAYSLILFQLIDMCQDVI